MQIKFIAPCHPNNIYIYYIYIYYIYIYFFLCKSQHCPNSLAACLPLADTSLAEHLISTLGRGATWINCRMVILGGGPFLVAKMIRGEHIGKGSLDFFFKGIYLLTCIH